LTWHLYDANIVRRPVTEKRKPQYDLVSIQAQFANPDGSGYRITVSAQDFAFAVLGIERAGVLSLVASVARTDFVKSMTSYADHRIWHDVYHVPFQDMTLYVKFTKDRDGFYLLISLKEK
jgi:motility quorum-sensing regulator/GCU-specific mRNA interferase toxin